MRDPAERDRIVRLYRLHFRAMGRGQVMRALKLQFAAEVANHRWVFGSYQ